MLIFENESLLNVLEEALQAENEEQNDVVYKQNRFYTAILYRKLFDKRLSVVLLYEVNGEHALMSFCLPLSERQRNAIDAAGYIPVLRSDRYIKAGTDLCMGIHYAYTQIRCPFHSDISGFVDAMKYLCTEMETYISSLN